MIKRVLIVWLILVAPAAAQSQTSATNPSGLAEMKKLDFLVGSWQGEGWMQFGPTDRRRASVIESVQPKVGGRVFVIEGLGKAKIPGKDEEMVVHNAFAVLYYDESAKRYSMRAFLANGQSVDAETNLNEGIFEWGFQLPQGKMRYKIRLNENGQWFEEGAISVDGGKTFNKFFEMTLTRTK
ncbi:MAG: hypothetical protein ABI882_03775 [Acidobacteriota bacterium]